MSIIWISVRWDKFFIFLDLIFLEFTALKWGMLKMGQFLTPTETSTEHKYAVIRLVVSLAELVLTEMHVN